MLKKTEKHWKCECGKGVWKCNLVIQDLSSSPSSELEGKNEKEKKKRKTWKKSTLCLVDVHL